MFQVSLDDLGRLPPLPRLGSLPQLHQLPTLLKNNKKEEEEEPHMPIVMNFRAQARN